MKILAIFIVAMVIAVTATAASPNSPAKMRPYTGIGLLLLPTHDNAFEDPISLYDAPALFRQGDLNRNKIPSFYWIFGTSPAVQPLFVMARKGSWLRVAYDDAGREAWLNPPHTFLFQTWDLFFKSHISRLLPGLQKKQYQVYQQPGTSPLMALTIKQTFKVLRLEEDWAMVLIEQSSLGWLRWRDEDGRLLIGIVTEQGIRKL